MKLNLNELLTIFNALQREYDITERCLEPEICYQISDSEKESFKKELKEIYNLETKILKEISKEKQKES